MASLIGYYSLIFGLCFSFLIIFFQLKILEIQIFLIIKYYLYFFTIFFCYSKFFRFNFIFCNSDFSNETVFNHSHTTKPLFYKISGTWGNHEGSLLLWLLVLTLFIFLFLLKSKNKINNIEF